MSKNCNPGEEKTKNISMRCTEKELETIQHIVKMEGITQSDFCRSAVMEKIEKEYIVDDIEEEEECQS